VAAPDEPHEAPGVVTVMSPIDPAGAVKAGGTVASAGIITRSRCVLTGRRNKATREARAVRLCRSGLTFHEVVAEWGGRSAP
jgi:hypothetical protein